MLVEKTKSKFLRVIGTKPMRFTITDWGTSPHHLAYMQVVQVLPL